LFKTDDEVLFIMLLPFFFQSVFIGISLAALPGPIFFELIRRVITYGFYNGLLLVLGEFIGNTLLLGCIFWGTSSFFTQPIIKIALYLVGSGIFFKLGLSAITLKENAVEAMYQGTTIKQRGSFGVGLGIAITSPIVIASWISLSGSYLDHFPAKQLAYLNILFISLGFLFFFIPFAIFISFTRKQISPKYILILSKLFGIILICYGIFFIYTLFTLFDILDNKS
jgi:threonine/homoserine/homoserine lactone efflux protein